MDNNLFVSSIVNFIEDHNLLIENSKIIVGLSGGPDSVFLLHFLKYLETNYNLTLIAAHVDHQWRENSQEDLSFCKNLANSLSVQFQSTTLSEIIDKIKKNDGSKEALGRQARRYFFEILRKEHQATSIAVGHHLQDQEETFFIRLVRGTTLNGLCSMRPKAGYYIRPLLETNKKEIIQYLENNAIPYLTDPSNESPEFLRNRIRKQIINPMAELDPRFDKNFLRTMHDLQNTDDYLQTIAQSELKNISKGKEINIEKLFQLNPLILNRVLILWLINCAIQLPLSEFFLKEIVRFLKQTKSQEHQIHQHWKLIKKNGFAKIETTR